MAYNKLSVNNGHGISKFFLSLDFFFLMPTRTGGKSQQSLFVFLVVLDWEKMHSFYGISLEILKQFLFSEFYSTKM